MNPRNLFIAVSSCGDWERNGYNDVARDCWLNECAALDLDYKFFCGNDQGAEPSEDRVVLSVPDGMEALTYKTRESLRWAYENNYDFVYRCFPDTFCRPERLLACGFHDHDYHGDFRGETAGPDNFCSGGPGYIVSWKSMEVLIDAPVLGTWRDDTIIQQAEDMWTGQILAKRQDRQFSYFDDQRFINRGANNPGPLRTNDVIASHLSYPGGYRPELMRQKYNEWLHS